MQGEDEGFKRAGPRARYRDAFAAEAVRNAGLGPPYDATALLRNSASKLRGVHPAIAWKSAIRCAWS